MLVGQVLCRVRWQRPNLVCQADSLTLDPKASHDLLDSAGRGPVIRSFSCIFTLFFILCCYIPVDTVPFLSIQGVMVPVFPLLKGVISKTKYLLV